MATDNELLQKIADNTTAIKKMMKRRFIKSESDIITGDSE